MATGVLKLDLKNHDSLAEVSKWISQINIGDTIYDIATHHGITFKNGSTDTTGVVWNGLTDIEVIIPSISDLVENPVEFVGTVDGNGTITYSTTGHQVKKGDLVYILADCTFNTIVCEKGDMAIYDGIGWHVISGENQISITGIDDNSSKTFTLNATAASVLSVEGKSLCLAVDYAGVKDVLTYSSNVADTLPLGDGSVIINTAYVALSKGADSTASIAVEKSINLPTALANGTVTINEKVFVSTDISFDAGSLPTATSNSSAIDVNVNPSLSIGKVSTNASTTGDFVASIDGAVKSVSLTAGSAGGYDIAYVTSVALTSDVSKKYVSDFRTFDSTKDNTADLVVPSAAELTGTTTFVSGFGTAAASGDVVSSIAVGAVTFDSAKSDFVTGLSTAVAGDSAGVITKVTFGNVSQDSTKEWFVTGISGASKVVTSVSLGDITFTSGNTTFASSAFVAASVNNNVLSFSTAQFMKPVSISQPSFKATTNDLIKGGVKLTGTAVSSAAFTKGGFTQASTAISYKSILTGTVDITQGEKKYMFDKAAVPALDTVGMGYKNLTVTSASIGKNSYQLNGTITANISANKVLTGFTAGSLPSLSISAPKNSLTGSVGTSLTTTSESWYAVATDSSNITIPGSYSLVSDSSVAGAIAVGAAGEHEVSGNITITSGTYITSIEVSGVAISPKSN